MYVLDLIARGQKCIELTGVFDSEGKAVTIELFLSKAENKNGAIAIDAPKTVRIRTKDIQDGTYDKHPRKRKPGDDLDRRASLPNG